MAVDVLNKGSTIRVKPDVVDECDILEYARAAIEAYGWRQGQRNPDVNDIQAVADKQGLSLHDAINLAAIKLGPRDVGKRNNKGDMGTVGTNLRTRATAVVAKHLPPGESDVTFNDKADDVGAVYAVLDAAIQEVCQ